jgi:RNA polymerase sigma-70 factor (ECF subfamily)
MRTTDLERLFTEHAGPLFAFLVYRTGDRQQAEDVLADSFERALRGRRGFDPRRGSEKSWLYTIALNCLRDQVRRAGVEERALARVGARDAPGADPMEQVEERDRVAHLMTALSPDERETVALRYGADLSVPEIAEILDLPLTTAEGRLYRALRSMRTVDGA